MRVIGSFFTSPIPYIALIVGGLIRVVADPRSASWLVYSGMIGAGLGLLAVLSGKARPRPISGTMRPTGSLTGAAQAIAIAAGTTVGLPSVLALGPQGSLLGALSTAAVASAIVAFRRTAGQRSEQANATPEWAQILILSLIVGAVLIIFATQIGPPGSN